MLSFAYIVFTTDHQLPSNYHLIDSSTVKQQSQPAPLHLLARCLDEGRPV